MIQLKIGVAARGRGARVLPILAVLGLASGALAQPAWISPTNGDFHDPTRWTGGVVPGAQMEAIFGAAPEITPYEVFFDQATATRGLRVRGHRPTFRLGGNSYNVSEITQITGPGPLKNAPRLTVEGGTMALGTLNIANNPGESGEFVVTGEGTAVDASTLQFVRDNSSGALRVLDHSTLRFRSAPLMGGRNSHGSIEIGGAGLMTTISGATANIRFGTTIQEFAINVHSGGRFILPTGSQVQVSQAPNAIVDIDVNGVGSMFDAGTELSLGGFGTARFLVSEGAIARAQRVRIGNQGAGSGRVTLTGQETRLVAAMELSVGTWGADSSASSTAPARS